MPAILLASTSLHRRTLLARLGLPFTCAAPGVPENVLPGEPPAARAARLALAKARAVASANPEAIVIGSDQVASLARPADPQLLHKPGDRATCREQLRAMAGNTVRFDTAVAVIHGNRTLTHVDLTQVYLRQLDDAAIESYMDREPSFDCAGGFKCEGLGVTLFESIASHDPTALIGLPLIWVCAALRQLGVSP
ncbi:MAG: Maf family protein [Pseudomonadota bacterium]